MSQGHNSQGHHTPIITQPHSLVTIWFINAAHPSAVMDTEPTPDRGFARKYLAQVNPAWPLTHIGDFDMTRSAAPSVDEFYIGGYPGVSVVQTVLPGLIRLSELPERLRRYVAAADVYATCTVPDDARMTEDSEEFHGLGGFAHWSGGTLKRAFSATRVSIFEDIGLPYPFEGPFWAGNEEATGIQLPFISRELAIEALESWLGFPMDTSGPGIPITAFAVDGRPEMKAHEAPVPACLPDATGATKNHPEGSGQGGDDNLSYDDYTPAADRPIEEKSTKELAIDAAKGLGRLAIHGGKQAWSGKYGVQGWAHRIGDEVRRRARNIGQK